MPKTNKRTCSTCAFVASTLTFELWLPSAGAADAMCCIGENRDVVVREGSGLEKPEGVKSSLACTRMEQGHRASELPQSQHA